MEGTVSGTGMLVFENTSRSRVSIFDLTGADMSGFNGVVQAPAPRSSLSSEGYNTPVQLQAAGDMKAAVMDLSVLPQGGKDPAGLGGWLTGDLTISGLRGATDADGGYYAGTEKNESYRNNQLVESDGTGVINLVKKGAGEQTCTISVGNGWFGIIKVS